MLDQEELDELMRPAVDAMLEVSYTCDVELKALAISRSIEIAR